MKISLNQLEIFTVVAKIGSFSSAARQLGKAQSTVSTAISNLEIDLGVKLFCREDKYPTLTSAGETLLRDACQIVESSNMFFNRAMDFSQGIDPKFSIAIDEVIPMDVITIALAQFAEKFPSVELEVLYGVLGDIQRMVEQERVNVGIMAPNFVPNQSLANKIIGHMDFIPVSSADHPLAKKEQISLHDLQSYCQLMIISRDGDCESEEVVLGKPCWWLERTPVIIDLVRKGVGWSFLHNKSVEAEIKEGTLVELPLQIENVDPRVPVFILWQQHYRIGSAGQWLIDKISQHL